MKFSSRKNLPPAANHTSLPSFPAIFPPFSPTFLSPLRTAIICTICSLCVIALTGCSRNIQAYEQTNILMGTVVTQTIYTGAGQGAGEEAAGHIQQLLKALEEEKLSWRIPASELARINQSAGEVSGYPLSEEMETYLTAILQAAEDSGGAFDPTIGKVTELWDIDEWTATGVGRLPEPEEVQRLLGETGYEKAAIKDGRIYLEADTSLDLGAAGKGIACDETAAYLKENKEITGAVVAIGGSILTYGQKPDGSPWQVGIADPEDTGNTLGVLHLKGDWYVSTSGDYQRYVEVDGVRYHHILDPVTGYPAATGIRAVTVVSRSGILSDILSTACFVAGKEDAMELAERYEAEILLVLDGGEIVKTKGMESLFTENTFR